MRGHRSVGGQRCQVPGIFYLIIPSAFLVTLNILTLGDVSLSGSLGEPPFAVGALDVVGIFGRRRWGQVCGITPTSHMVLIFLRQTNRPDEFFVLLPPVATFFACPSLKKKHFQVPKYEFILSFI
jgi:hypothetical protein